jgi:anti-sigma factor RsiW
MSSQGQSESSLQRDRFEMLSAYLDGEVTATERRQVEEWLAHDPSVQQLHARLLKLRQAFRVMPAPAPSQPVEAAIDQVFAKIDRRPKLDVIWGGRRTRNFALPLSLAAMFVGAVTVFGLNRSNAPGVPQPIAVQQPAEPTETGGLMVALDQPVVSMPQDSTPEKSPNGKTFDHKSHDAH